MFKLYGKDKTTKLLGKFETKEKCKLEMKVYKDKCKPYVTLYHLKTGMTLKTKVVSANEYANAPFKENSILNVWFDDKYKSQLVNGKWVRTDEKEKVMAHWEIMKN